MRRQVGALLVALTLAGCGADVTHLSGASGSPRSPRPAASADPTASTSPPTASAAPPAPAPPGPSEPVIGIVRVPFAGREMRLTMVGAPGGPVAWRAATDAEVAAVAWGGNDEIALGRLGGRDLVLAWIGTVCDVRATLTIGPGRLVVSPVPREGCDAMAVGRGVVLSFAQPVDPASIAVVLEDTVLLPEPT